MVKLALVGSGRLAYEYGSRLLQKNQLLAVVSSDKRMDTSATDWKVPSLEHLEQLSEVGLECTGLVVADPTPDSEIRVREALELGYHVLWEQVSVTEAQILELFSLARSRRQFLVIGGFKHFDPYYQKFNQLLEEEKETNLRIQQLCLVSRKTLLLPISSLSPEHLIQDLVVPELDVALWLLKEVPEKVMAIGSTTDPYLQEKGSIEFLEIILQYSSGKMGKISVSWNAPEGCDQRAEVRTDRGRLTLENPTPPLVRHLVSGKTGPPLTLASYRFTSAFQAQLQSFLNLVQGGFVPKERDLDTPPITWMLLIRRTRIQEAILESLRTGTLVTVNRSSIAVPKALLDLPPPPPELQAALEGETGRGKDEVIEPHLEEIHLSDSEGEESRDGEPAPEEGAGGCLTQ